MPEDAAPIRAEIARVVVEKKRANPETGEMEVYERVEFDLKDDDAAD